MTELDFLIQVLQQSSERYKPKKKLTISHLLNIAKMAKRRFDNREEAREYITMEDIENFELLLKQSKFPRPFFLTSMKERVANGHRCFFFKRKTEYNYGKE